MENLKNYILEGKPLYLVSNDKGTQYNVYFLKDNALVRIWHGHFFKDWQNVPYEAYKQVETTSQLDKFFKKHGQSLPGYYNFSRNSDYNFKCNAWGTSRPLEIVLSIGHALGLKHSEIKQNYINL